MTSEPEDVGQTPSEPPPEKGRAEPCNDRATCWIEAARGGSIEAFGELFANCRGYLLTVAREEIGLKLREKTRPSDVVQQTMITAQKIFGRFEGTSERELLAWLRGILLHHISDLSKFFHREKRHMARELSLERDLPGDERGGLVADERLTPGRAVALDEEAQALMTAMARLSPEHREVIVLRNWERLSFDDVGRRMQRSADAARKLWARAIDSLRQHCEGSNGRAGEN